VILNDLLVIGKVVLMAGYLYFWAILQSDNIYKICYLNRMRMEK